jgi:redox-sensitive bicupin YhaK (pirin superfamily)
MEKVVHRSESRGFVDHGWLISYKTFSYGNYYDPRRIHFGALRVLNDDTIEGGEGFNSHPHDNMEIVHIPLKGAIEHGDSMGNISVASVGELQILSAGTGLIHHEYNNSLSDPLEYLQIWIFPEEYELPPRYSKVTLAPPVKNELQLMICPSKEPEVDDSVGRIRQSAWLYTADLDEGMAVRYKVHPARYGAYIFVIEGAVTIDGTHLKRRDGLGLWDAEEFEIRADVPSHILIIETPMRKE